MINLYQSDTVSMKRTGMVIFWMLMACTDEQSLTSRLRRAAAEQLELKIVRAKALPLQVLQ